jgi:hypothetical protein
VFFGRRQAEVAQLLRVEVCGDFWRGPAVAGERIPFRERPAAHRLHVAYVVEVHQTAERLEVSVVHVGLDERRAWAPIDIAQRRDLVLAHIRLGEAAPCRPRGEKRAEAVIHPCRAGRVVFGAIPGVLWIPRHAEVVEREVGQQRRLPGWAPIEGMAIGAFGRANEQRHPRLLVDGQRDLASEISIELR